MQPSTVSLGPPAPVIRWQASTRQTLSLSKEILQGPSATRVWFPRHQRCNSCDHEKEVRQGRSLEEGVKKKATIIFTRCRTGRMILPTMNLPPVRGNEQ